MTNKLFRQIRSPRREKALMDIGSTARKEIEKALEETKKALVNSHEAIVKNWKSDVGFRAAKYIKKDRMWVTVFPVGSDREIWFYVDLGTKPHPITAKRAPYLTFKAGEYVPKTLAKPARTVSGGGQVRNAKWVRTERVQHPGSEGRHFTKQIAEDIQPSFKREVENAFRRTANAGG